MTSRISRTARASQRSETDESRVRLDIIQGRRSAGLSQEDVGRACGLSRSQVARLESGLRRGTIRELACLGAAVGLDVRLQAFPAGDALRDAGQNRLLERLRVRLHPSLGWSTEVPLPANGDLRAWDAVIQGPGWRLPVEAETAINDLQALERRLALKRRDGGVDHLVLLVADTRRNRQALRSARPGFAGVARGPRAILAALERGRDPGGSAIVLL